MSFNRSTELISINSAAEQAFVLQELKDMKITQVWLGLNDRKVEGRYEWSDKSPVIYRNWDVRQPSTGVAAGFSDCTVIDGNTQNGTWSTSPCFFNRGYICKRKIGKEVDCSCHSILITFTGTHELTIHLTRNVCGFIAQLVAPVMR